MSSEYIFKISATTVAWYSAIVATVGAVYKLYNLMSEEIEIVEGKQ